MYLGGKANILAVGSAVIGHCRRAASPDPREDPSHMPNSRSA